jgi:hypothetical protein
MRSVLRYLSIEQGVSFEDVDVISLLFMRWKFGVEDRQTNQIECNVRLSIQWLPWACHQISNPCKSLQTLRLTCSFRNNTMTAKSGSAED